jgi:predicted nucleotidyltransferase
MYTKENIDIIVNRFINMIKKDISVEQVYLFGSYAKGNVKEYSDIDLAIVSNDFQGIRFYDRKKLLKYLIKINTDIEIHTFKTEDFTTDDPFVAEIIKTGLRVN